MRELSIVIPTLNEEEHLASSLRSISSLGAEVIVVDGGSHDHTVRIARTLGAGVIETGPGRGAQLQAGAEAASGTFLFFLHADCRLSADAVSILTETLRDPDFSIGTFRLRLDSHHPLYRLYSWFTRFDSLWTTFGDQGIVVRRSFYEKIGGFPPWPILEDVALLREARRHGTVRSLRAEVITSARRFERNGIVRQQFRNGSILLRYLLGSRPDDLAPLYRAHGDPVPEPQSYPAITPLSSNGIQVDSKLCTELTLTNLGR